MIEWIVSSSALAAVLILLRQILRGKISLRLQYALWGLLLLRLLIPVSLGSSAISVSNALPREARSIPETVVTGGHVTIRTDHGARDYVLPGQMEEYHADRESLTQSGELRSVGGVEHVLTFKSILRILWIAGMGIAAICLLGSNLLLARKLRRSRRILTEKEALPVYLTNAADTPCLFGFFRPAIYVTPEAASAEDRLRHVIRHELTHYRHGDQWWSLLRGACLVLHWYNPLVWCAAFLSRRDAELACDEAAIRSLGEGERAAYGRTLIEMTCRKCPALLLTATTMTGGKGGIRERIRLIAKKPKTVAAALVALLLIAAIAVGCTFTGAKEKTREPTEAPATAAPSAEPTAAPIPTPTEVPEAEIPQSILFLRSDSTDYETVARDYAGAYVGQFIQAVPESSFKAEEATVETRIMEVREDGEAFIFQAHIGFVPADPDRFAEVVGAGNGGWNEEGQRFYVWRYFCLEKRENGWTGVDLDVLDSYSEYTAVYGDYFASVPNPRADKAIREAAIAFNKDSHTEGEALCESHVLVAKESAPGSGGSTVETYYLMILYQAYDWVDGAPKAVSGSYIPSALTFEVSPEGEYALLEYWTPRDSPFYWDDLRAKFPADVPDEDLNNQNPKYLERVMTSCEAQARAYFSASMEPSDEWFTAAALPYARDYAAATGRLLRAEGATVIRNGDGASAEVRIPCALGSRFSVSVSFRKGEDGEWRVLPENAVELYTEQWRNARVYLDLGDQTVPDAVADYAIDTAYLELDYLEQTCGYIFDEAKVTAVTQMNTGTVGLWEGYNLYRLEWRFHPAEGEEILLAGGMTMEDGYLTEWGSAGQPYILIGWKNSNGVETWERICVTNTDTIETEYGTPEMIEKYGNAYTAAAVELRAKARERQSLLNPLGFSVASPASSPAMIGQDWAKAFAARFTGAPEDDPYYCRSMEVRRCELYAESLLNEPKQYVYVMSFACDPADTYSFYSQLAGWGQDGGQPDWLRFDWFVVLEDDLKSGWECAQAGTGGYGGWGYLNYGWEADELLDRLVTEQVGGEDTLMLLPLIDWGEFDRLPSDTWDASFNALWTKCEEACLTEGRYWDAERSVLYSDKYSYDQIIRDLYVILGFFHADGAYSEGLAYIMAKQYDYDPGSFEQCLTQYLNLTEEQERLIRLNIQNERGGGILHDAQLRFYDASGKPVSDDGGWYELSMIDSIGVAWSGDAPLGVRLLTTPTGTGTYEQTQILAQRSLSREETEGKEIRFTLSELNASAVMGHLWAELDYGKELHASPYYQVYREVESVTLNRTDFTLGCIGESYTLQATVAPSGVGVSVRWTSDDPEVATVDDNGAVTAVGHGTTRVVASAGGVSAACTVRVSAMSAGTGAGSGG